MIDPQVKEAVVSRKEAGFTDEQIIEDFVAAGYTEAQVQEILTQLSPEPPPPAMVPPPVPTTANEASDGSHQAVVSGIKSTVEPQVARANTHKKHQLPLLVGITLAALTVLLAVWFFASNGSTSLSRLFSSAPYQTEAELIENVFTTREQTKAYGFNMEYQFAVEERTDEAVELSAAVLGESGADFLDYAAASLDAFPREIDARFFASGMVDLRNTENPSLDISARVNVVAEPVLFSGAGSARLIDGVGYGRIDDFPENMKPYLEGIPLETWIVLGSEGDVSLPNVPYIPVQSVEAVRSAIELYAEAIPPEFYVALESLATTTDVDRSISSMTQLAQLAAPLLEQSAEAESMTELRARVEKLLMEYPPILFVGEPEKVDWFEESVYRYEFDINSANIRQLVIAAAEEAGASVTPDMEAELDEIFVEINRVITAVNTLTTFASYLRADGTSAGFSLDSVVALSEEVGYEPQFALRLKTHQTVQNDGLEIIAPEDVHPLTLEEIEEKKRRELQENYPGIVAPRLPGEAENLRLDAASMQFMGSIQIEAELNRAQYGNYEAVCTNSSINRLMESTAANAKVAVRQDTESSVLYVVCNDSENAYAVSAPLVGEAGLLWCVDNTGFAGKVTSGALSSAADYTCELD